MSPPPRATRHFWLSMHLGYRCRDSGACCSSGWPIPMERDRARLVAADVASGRVAPVVTPWLTEAPGAPPEVAGTLAIQHDGHCVFHRPPGRMGAPRGCVIHARRPASCEHFPYVCATDPRGVRVTLSHYCPTAAALLVAWEGPVTIVEGPPVLADGRLPEGLDARESLPPLAAGGRRLMDWEEVTAWERAGLERTAMLAQEMTRPDVALFEIARAAVVPPLSWPHAPEGLARGWEARIVPAWPRLSAVAGRYLASKLFASWALYRGAGLPDVLRAVDIARAVLGVEAVRACLDAERTLDTALLERAIRRSDLLLVHYADPAAL